MSKTKAVGIASVLLFSGALLGYFLARYSRLERDAPSVVGFTEHEVTSELVQKVYGDVGTFGQCDPEQEYKNLRERFLCNKKKKKASKSFRSLNRAEKQIKQWIETQDFASLEPYVSCEATDLTWYELHCEADLLFVDQSALKALFNHIESRALNPLKSAQWKRERPKRRQIRNPRWRLRSRLISKDFSLDEPWAVDPHPTENGTIVLIEQKLDGQVFIVGIPITGLSEKTADRRK